MTEMTLRHLLCFDKFESFTGGRVSEDIIRAANDLLEIHFSLRHTACEEHSLANMLFFPIPFLVLRANWL